MLHIIGRVETLAKLSALGIGVMAKPRLKNVTNGLKRLAALIGSNSETLVRRNARVLHHRD